ncbi:hypothetical protein SAMN05192566_2588 [Methylophilus rhizosphaerae]|uniref:Uncharacterized protein n=1 Tax=Methylophilus rhizosphaerae TaxID=492660 RepID=A0A1G9F344_9PROT|nr:hypothetical protein SAMN05192566_2588 [Methylophilus rhizosphaerae]
MSFVMLMPKSRKASDESPKLSNARQLQAIMVGALFFDYFLGSKHQKVTRPEAKKNATIKNTPIQQSYLNHNSVCI